jgi:POT family proton-dependent oligopeptide transporter
MVDGEIEEETVIVTASTVLPEDVELVKKTTKVIDPIVLNVGDKVNLIKVRSKLLFLDQEESKTAIQKLNEEGKESPLIQAEVTEIKENEVEIQASWFGILNSLFIIIFAPLFSKWWESKYNPPAAVKYGLGLILVGVGFAALMYGAYGIVSGAESAAVSIIWLILAYLFHTLGELCLSPVALSYISKLVPARMIALMFGVWYVAVAIGNKAAGKMGGSIEKIAEANSLSYFFMLLTVVPIVLGVIGILLNPVIKKLMHGVK